jgi:(E)-4-hydroxy-3-methylbut-2-enyl-diphosphate synthase
MTNRRNSVQINIGGVVIGSDNKIAIQSMTNTKTTDIQNTMSQIIALKQAGCDIIRIAVPDKDAAVCFKTLAEKSPLPVVADIHFDYKLAIMAIENGAAKIRINPGNMAKKDLDAIIDCAKEHKVPIRLGVNGGSTDKALLKKYASKDEALIESLTNYIRYFEDRAFNQLVLSVKSSDVSKTIMLNERIAALCNYPIHIGLTEAGVPEVGIVKNTIAISTLLQKGIGDTIRVSLTGDPVQEVLVAKEILRSLGYEKDGVEFVSCPKCGRCVIDLENIASKVYDYVKKAPKKIKVAVMGCEVNGPGECADADIGLAGGKSIAFFKRGKIYRLVNPENALEEFLKEIDKLMQDDT